MAELVEVQEAEGLKIGDLFTDHVQPHGTRTMRVERIREGRLEPRYLYGCTDDRYWQLDGVVVEGTETSRLFQHTSTKSIVGRPHTSYGVRADEMQRHEKVTAICG